MTKRIVARLPMKANTNDLNSSIKNTPNMFDNEVAGLAIGYIAALAREAFSIDRGI